MKVFWKIEHGQGTAYDEAEYEMSVVQNDLVLRDSESDVTICIPSIGRFIDAVRILQP